MRYDMDEFKKPTSQLVDGDVAWFHPDEDDWPSEVETTYDGKPRIRVVMPKYLVGGDYSENDGGLVRANVNVFSDTYGELEGTYWWPIRGGYGSFGIVVRDDAWKLAAESGDEEEQNLVLDMLEALHGLDNYPYLSGAEDEEVKVQMDTEAEAWADYGCSDFWSVLQAVLFNDEEDELASTFSETLAEQDEQGCGVLGAIYHGLGDIFGIYPEFEGSGDNISPVYSFNNFARQLKPVIEAWEQPGEQNQLRLKILDAMVSGDADAFRRGGDVSKVVSWTYRNLNREPHRTIPVIQDWIAEQGGGAAAWNAVVRGAQLGAFGRFAGRAARRRRA
jgi:hypothetical protein